MFCESCGSPVPDGQTNCPNCGAAVYQAAPQPAAQPVYQQPVYQQPVAQPVYQQPLVQAQPIVMAAPQPVRKTNGWGIAGLIFGILTLVTCWIPVVPLILGFFGLVLSIIGLCMKNAGKGQAIAGLILTIIGAIIGACMTLLLYGLGTYMDKAYEAESAYYSSISESLEDEESVETTTEETEEEDDSDDEDDSEDEDDEDDSDDDEE